MHRLLRVLCYELCGLLMQSALGGHLHERGGGEEVMGNGKIDYRVINYFYLLLFLIRLYLANWGKSLKTLNWDPRPATSLAT